MTARRPRVRRRVAVLIGISALAGCRIQEVPRTGVDPAEIAREAIDATRDAYRRALLEGDADAVADVFTPDAILAEPDTPDVVSATEIELAMRRFFAHAVVTDLLLEPDALDIATGGIANEIGRFEQTLELAEQEAAIRRGRYAIRWMRGPDAAWRISRMLYNLYPADPPADTSATR